MATRPSSSARPSIVLPGAGARCRRAVSPRPASAAAAAGRITFPGCGEVSLTRFSERVFLPFDPSGIGRSIRWTDSAALVVHDSDCRVDCNEPGPLPGNKPDPGVGRGADRHAAAGRTDGGLRWIQARATGFNSRSARRQSAARAGSRRDLPMRKDRADAIVDWSAAARGRDVLARVGHGHPCMRVVRRTRQRRLHAPHVVSLALLAIGLVDFHLLYVHGN